MKTIELQMKIKDLLEITTNDLNNQIQNIKLIPNPLYMVEENQREMIWCDEDYQIIDTLGDLICFYIEILDSLN